jgi:HD-like signal output (HDOD) protein
MTPSIRNGLASTLGSLATWWRARGMRHIASPDLAIPWSGHTGIHQAELPLSPAHAEQALRSFLGFALDERPEPAEQDLADSALLIEKAALTLASFEVHARYLPRRPSLLPRLLSAMNTDASSMRELAVIIGGDPTLLGNLLRVANSVFYRTTDKPVDNLERAVTMVGMDGIRSVIATALLHPVMTTGTGWFARFPENIWEHTQYAADAAEAHAVHIEHVDGFQARLLTLLHGLATNTVFRIVRDEVLVAAGEASKPAVVQLLQQWAAPTAQRIAATWELPPELQAVMATRWGQSPLGRSLFFGQLAGSQIVMVRRGRVKESSARATLLASDSQRVQVDRLWSRLAVACRQTTAGLERNDGRGRDVSAMPGTAASRPVR